MIQIPRALKFQAPVDCYRREVILARRGALGSPLYCVHAKLK